MSHTPDAIVQISPKVFISYAWENEEIKQWVKKLATELRNNGVDAKLDQWEVVPGDQMPMFMEKSVTENNYVLLICTERYKYKSENRIGGVGYEGDIMTAEVLQMANHRKFIPILRSGDMNVSIPGWLRGKLFIDFTNPLHYENSFENLLSTLLNRREAAPALGRIPERFQEAIAEIVEQQQEREDEQVVLKSIVLDAAENVSQKASKQKPFLEADLVWHGSSRSPRGYSNKNPTELDENGRLITVIGAGVKPIIFWELSWRFDLQIHNNSTDPAFNIQIESIGDAHFAELEKLRPVNNLQPYEQLTLKATFYDAVEDVHTIADQILSFKIPEKLEGLVLKITYLDEDRSSHITLVKIEKNQITNSKG